MDFKNLIGKRLSILITGKGGKKETYSGIVDSFEDNFIQLTTLPNENFEIDKFIIRADIVESIWVFKERN